MKPHVASMASRLWLITVVISVALALALSALRVLTPVWFNLYSKPRELIAQFTGEEFKIGGIKTTWRGFGPVIELDQVEFRTKAKVSPFRVDKLELGFNILSYLLYHRFYPSSINISDLDLQLIQHPNNLYEIPGMATFSSDPGGANTQIAEWLMNLQFIKLQTAEIEFTSLEGVAHQFEISQGKLVNYKDRHQIDLMVDKVDGHSDNINLEADFYAANTDLQQMYGSLFIGFNNASLAEWSQYFKFDNLSVMQGHGQAKLWLKWKNNTWQDIQLGLKFADLQLKTNLFPDLNEPFDLQGDFELGRKTNGWGIVGNNVMFHLNNKIFPNSNFSLEYTKTDVDQITLQSDRFYLGAFSPLLAKSVWGKEAVVAQILAAHPDGTLQDLKVDVKLRDKELLTYNASGRFSNLSFDAYDFMPGITGLDGTVTANETTGHVLFVAGNPEINAPKLFSKPLEISKASADVNWTFADDTLKLHTDNLYLQHPDWEINGQANLQLSKDQSPVLDMQATVSDLDAHLATHYLPDRILEPALLRWLQAAPQEGVLSDIKAEIQGPLDKFPFIDGSGKFKVAFNLNDVKLHYAPDWPEITAINGALRFEGQSMYADVTTAKLFDADIHPSKVSIPLLNTQNNTRLNIISEVTADAKDGRRFILESPLQKSLGASLRPLTISGPINVNLDLMINLDNDDEVTLQAAVKTNAMQVNAPEWKFKLDNIAGEFNLAEDGIEGQNLHAQSFGKPVILNIIKHKVKGKIPTSEFILQGNIATKDLQQNYPSNIWAFVNGNSDYTAHLFLEADDQKNDTQQKLVISSDLVGISSRLPQPFGKTAAEKRPQNLSIQFLSNDRLLINVDVNKQLSAVFSGKMQHGISIERGGVVLGETPQIALPQQGFVIDGSVDDVDLAAWQKFYKEWTALEKVNEINALLQSHLNIKNAHVWGYTLHDAGVVVNKQNKKWDLRIDSRELVGNLQIPIGADLTPWQFDFQRCVLKDKDKTNNQNTQPKTIQAGDLPAFNFACKNFIWGELQLGNVNLNAARQPEGLSFTNISINNPNYNLRGTGKWVTQNNKSRTELKGRVEMQDIEKLLKSFGFGSEIADSSGSIDYVLDWAADPTGFSFANLDGALALDLKSGRIIEGNSNVGKMISLFSLPSLQRRLRLDFSDLFKQGYSFDYLRGGFKITNGNATTTDTVMDGPVAYISIAGRTGLYTEDLDFQVVVAPHVSGGVPLAAALVAANPAVGAVAFLVDRMFTPQIRKLASYSYQVKGSWRKPQISLKEKYNPEEALPSGK